jgi:molybdopterin molybdotransferase
MLSLSEARSLITQSVHVLAPERVSLSDARGRFLREALIATEDMPAFDRSAMDGYAVNRDDPSGEFRIVAEVAAGALSERPIGAGECARVFTGSSIPPGANQVVMQEFAQRQGDTVSFSPHGAGGNIRLRGEDAREGSVLIERGMRLGPIELALCAHIGVVSPLVSPRPRVFHVVTGSELVSPEIAPAPGQIRDSNSILTGALVAESGAALIAQHRTGDDLDLLLPILHGVPATAWDVLLLSGGAGPGDHDLGLRALRDLGFSVQFQQLNLRPGKPLIFATRERQIAFVIPGNPLAHFVCWHVGIDSALQMLTRGSTEFALVNATLGGDKPLPGNARETWWPALFSWENDTPVMLPLKWQSSGDLTGLAGVDALIRVPSKSPPIAPGENVLARLPGKISG